MSKQKGFALPLVLVGLALGVVIIGGVVSGPRIVIWTAGEMEVMAWVPGRRGFIVIKAAYTVRPAMDGKSGIDNVTIAWPLELRIP